MAGGFPLSPDPFPGVGAGAGCAMAAGGGGGGGCGCVRIGGAGVGLMAAAAIAERAGVSSVSVCSGCVPCRVATCWSPWLRNSSCGVMGRVGVEGLVTDSML
jgi:hypothetical protein